MKNSIRILIVAVFTLFMCTLTVDSDAQLAAGQSKFLGNTHTQGQTPINFDLYWNQITPGNAGKWASCEQNRDDFNYWLWLDRAYSHARENGMVFKEHTLIWGHSSGEPAWMSSVPQDEQMDEVLEWFDALSERYPDLEMIDVVNEPLHAPPSYTEALGGDGETGWDWVVWSFEQAREYFPNATLILNEYNILNYDYECENFLEIVKILQDRGLIDGIGCQAHSLEAIAFGTIQANLEALAATGLDIYISEYEARGDDATQLALFQEQFTYFWEHPSVKGVTLWGYLEGDMWRAEAYLLAADGVTERPALQWLKEYFNYYPENVQYNFATYTNGNGSISLNPAGGVYDPFTTVKATATADEGYVFSHWSGDVGGSTNPTSLAVISNRSLTANFIEEGFIPTYDLSVSVSGNGTVSQTPEGTVFAEGATVTLTATPDENYKFDGWTGTVNSSSLTIEVTMESNTNLTATFSEIGGAGCDGESEISMNYTQDGEGEYCFVASGELSYVSSWNLEYLEVNGKNCTNTWTNSIPASEDGLIHIYYYATVSYAHFEMVGTDNDPKPSYSLTTNTTPGGSIELNPAGGSYIEGTVVTATAVPETGYEFSAWSGDASGNNTITTVTMDSDKSITATFTEVSTPTYLLTINVEGNGSVTNNGGMYAEGDIVDVSAIADEGYVFDGWTGDIISSDSVISITMNNDIAITANFIEQGSIVPEYDLNITIVGNGSVTPSGGTYEENVELVLQAVPDASYKFTGWSGDVEDTTDFISIIMDDDKDIVATFIYDGDISFCDNPETINLPITQDGEGVFCWVTSDDIAYVNSWNMASVKINGIDFTNTWASAMPEKVGGLYYISIESIYSWSHLEIAAMKSADESSFAVNSIISPNPFEVNTSLYFDNPELITNIEIIDQTGRLVSRIDESGISSQINIGESLQSGLYFIRVNSIYGSKTHIISKN